MPWHTPEAFGVTEIHAHGTIQDHSLSSCLLYRGIVLWVLQFWRCWIKGSASQMHFKWKIQCKVHLICFYCHLLFFSNRRQFALGFTAVSSCGLVVTTGTERNAYLLKVHLYLKMLWFRFMMEQTYQWRIPAGLQVISGPRRFSLLNVIVLLKAGCWIWFLDFFSFFDAPHSPIKLLNNFLSQSISKTFIESLEWDYSLNNLHNDKNFSNEI